MERRSLHQRTLSEERGMNKKAQGLSLTTVIVAGLAIVVLTLLLAIFTGKSKPRTQKALSQQTSAILRLTQKATRDNGRFFMGLRWAWPLPSLRKKYQYNTFLRNLRH